MPGSGCEWVLGVLVPSREDPAMTSGVMVLAPARS